MENGYDKNGYDKDCAFTSMCKRAWKILTSEAALIMLAVTIGTLCIVLCINWLWNNNQENPAKTESKSADTLKTEWRYGSDADEFYGGKTEWAKLESSKSVFKSYSGDEYGKSMALTITSRKDGCKLELRVDGESFYIRSDYPIKVMFDGGEPYNVDVDFVADDMDGIYVYTSRFWQDMARSKELKVMCNFYDQGQHTFVFNTAGLKWKFSE